MLFILESSFKYPLTFYELVYLLSLLSSILCIQWNVFGIFPLQNFTLEREIYSHIPQGIEISLQIMHNIGHAYYVAVLRQL